MSGENNKKKKVSFLGLDDKKEEEMRSPVNVPSNTFICAPMNTSIRPPICSPIICSRKKIEIESEIWFDNK